MNDASNPLLRHIHFPETVEELIKSIRFTGLEGVDINSLSLMERFEYLRGEAAPYEPTINGINLVTTLQSMIRSSYRARNPILIENKRRWFSSSGDVKNTHRKPLVKLPVAQTNGLLTTGIPGLGKTQAIARYLSTLPQVIAHDEETEAGWISQTQVVFLHVGMSHDGSRSGFLEAILLEIDSVLDTSFAEEYRKLRRVDLIAVHVIQCLKQHFLGILVIDEIQEKNLIKSGKASEMQTFLLALINSGLPTVLVGNPAGFNWLDGFAQGEQRTDERGNFTFHPCGALDDDTANNWEAVFKGISSYYVLPSPVGDLQSCSSALLELSGGIPRLALSLWRKAQDQALVQSKDCIMAAGLYEAYNSLEFSASARIQAQGFHTRNPKILETYRDMNSAYYMEIWKNGVNEGDCSDNGNDIGVVTKSNGLPSGGQRMRSEKSKYEAAKTRQNNKEEKREQLAKTLTQEDLRNKGVTSVVLDGLSQCESKEK